MWNQTVLLWPQLYWCWPQLPVLQLPLRLMLYLHQRPARSARFLSAHRLSDRQLSLRNPTNRLQMRPFRMLNRQLQRHLQQLRQLCLRPQLEQCLFPCQLRSRSLLFSDPQLMFGTSSKLYFCQSALSVMR